MFKSTLGLIFCLGTAGFSLLSCKTSEKKRDAAPDVISGVFKGGKALLAIPNDVKKGLSLADSSVTTKPTKLPQDTGSVLGLTDSGKPTTTSGVVESIKLECYNRNSSVIAKDWYLYVELRANGSVIKSSTTANVEGCDSMQLELKDLARTSKYVVYASLFYRKGNVTIVYYEGETKEFSPSDTSVELKLGKLRMDQVINVQLEKTEKEICEDQNKFLWNGKRCIDQPHALVFPHSDFSDYSKSASAKGARDYSCVQVDAKQQGVQYKCSYAASQLFKAKLHGVQDVVETTDEDGTPVENRVSVSWFTLIQDPRATGDSGKDMCLTVVGDDLHLEAQACFGDKEDPKENQLFKIKKMAPENDGLADSFLIMAEVLDTSVKARALRCMSIPATEGDLSNVAPINNNAKIRMSPCLNDAADGTNKLTDSQVLNLKKTQYMRFMQKGD